MESGFDINPEDEFPDELTVEYSPEDLPDKIIVDGVPLETCSFPACTCEDSRPDVEIERWDGLFFAEAWRAPWLNGAGETPEEALQDLLDYLTSIPWN